MINFIEIKTEEDFNKLFPSEESAIRYFYDIRCKTDIGCPKCGCKKIYKMNDNKKFKCSQADCRNRFSVTSGSILDNTKITVKDWLWYIFSYIKSNGRFSTNGLHQYRHSFVTDMRLRFLLEDIPKYSLSKEQILEQAIKNIWIKRGQIDFRNINYWRKSSISPLEIIDFNDKECYRKIYTTTKKLMIYALHRKWIFYEFTDVEAIISESLIAIYDTGIKEINGSLIVEIIKKTLSSMWWAHVKENPKLHIWYKKYRKTWKKDNRVLLRTPYIKSLISDAVRDKGKDWKEYQTLNDISILIKEKREKIKKKRELSGYGLEREFLY